MFLRDNVLAIGQIKILASYFFLNERDIEISIQSGYKCFNTYRNEKIPSLSFKNYNGKIIAKDFGDDKFSGDVFQIVGAILCLNCNKNIDFIKICEHIINRFRNNEKGKVVITIGNYNSSLSSPNGDINKSTIIEILPRNHNSLDYNIFMKQGITEQQIRDNITVVNKYWINGKENAYRYSVKDPCYAYNVMYNNKYKLYFPLRNRDSKYSKFLTNNKIEIECLDKIKHSDITIFTKAFKDKLLLERLCKDTNINNIQIFSLTSEVVKFKKDILDLVKKYTRSKIIINMLDNDNVGKTKMIEMSEQHYFYNIIATIHSYIFAKDLTDLCKLIGYDKVKNYFNIWIKPEIIKWIK